MSQDERVRCRRHASADNTSRDRFLKAARVGLAHYPQDALRQPAERRLAFRELGLALGLHAVEVVNNDLADGVIERRVRKRVEPLLGYLPLRDEIESFWRDLSIRGRAHGRSTSTSTN